MKNGQTLTQEKQEYMLSPKEVSLIRQLRQVPYGEIVIVMHDGQPDRIERGIEKKKL